MTNTCRVCGDVLPDGRAELNLDYCLKSECYDACFSRTPYVVLGVHKSTPIVCAVDDPLVTARVSYMMTK